MSGTAWVLLRGLTRETRHWGTFAEMFAAATGGARTVAIDLPGNGSAHRQRSPLHIDAMAEHCRVRLRELGLQPPYSVFAMSMGAMVATAWARQRPEDIDAAVLVNTSMRPFSPPHWRLRPAACGRLLRLLFSSNRDAERLTLQLTSNLRCDDTALIEQWASFRDEHPVSRQNALAQLIAAARFSAPRANPFASALLLVSEADRLVDPRCTHALASSWGCASSAHPTAGHDLTLDDPEWVCRHVTAWLEQRAQAAHATAAVDQRPVSFR